MLDNDVTGRLPDDDHQFGLVFHLLRLRRQDDCVARIEDGRGRFQEQQRHFGYLGIVFLGMFDIVAPDADDFRRLDRRQQPDGFHRQRYFLPAVFAVDIAVNRSNFILKQPAICGSFGLILITDDAHKSLQKMNCI